MEKAFVQVLKLRNTANWLFANSNYVLKRKNKDGRERKEKGNRKKRKKKRKNRGREVDLFEMGPCEIIER